MQDVFGILTLLSIVLFVIGLIKPKLVVRWGNPSRKSVTITYVPLFFIFLFAFNSVAPTKAAPPLTPAFNWATADITEDNVRKALAGESSLNIVYDSKFPGDIEKIQIADSKKEPGKKTIAFIFKPGEMWDETTFVSQMGGTIIRADSLLFANPNVDVVEGVVTYDMTDQYGKTAPERVLKLQLRRTTVDKIDWTGLADRHFTDPGNIYRIADFKYIHPAIVQGIDRSTVKL